MSNFDNYNLIAGDEDLELHKLFGFTEVPQLTAANASAPAEISLLAPPLGSPFIGPFEDLQGQVDWLSPSAAGLVDVIDDINYDDFLALDESADLALDEGTDVLPAPAEGTPAAPPAELAESSTPQDDPTAAPEPAGDFLAATQLDSVRDEIAQLKAALSAENLRPQVSTTPKDRQCSSISSPRKRRLDEGEVSPPKRQITAEVGPIEALWSPRATDHGRGADHTNLSPPATPKPYSPPVNFTAQPCTPPPINTPDDHAISPENLQSIKDFLDDNPPLIYGAAQQVDVSTSPSDNTMGHVVNTRVKRVPLKQASGRALKATTKTPTTTNKVTKKTKATPKKQNKHQRTASTTSNAPPSLVPSTPHRSIHELLAANFYSLNAQEKVRIMLPMLRNLDPRELENNLAAIPSIQAKGVGHEVRVAKAIRDSPPTPEDDDILATKLTFGYPPSPTRAAKHNSTCPPALAAQDPSLLHKIVHTETAEDHGAVRQREALDKAAALQAQGRKR